MLDRPQADALCIQRRPVPASTETVLPVKLAGLSVRRGQRNLLDAVDLVIDRGGITMMLGPNGAGKSLLLRLIAGLVVPDQGSVNWCGQPPDRSRARQIGFVFQKPVMLRRSVLANVLHALKACGVARAERNEAALRALETASLAHLAHMPARLMSGGEQQRLALARALAMRPQLLLLDEPTANLDPASTAAIEALVLKATESGMRVIFVSHDLGQARRLADEVIFMHAGRIVEKTPSADFFATPQSRAAARFLAGDLLLDKITG